MFVFFDVPKWEQNSNQTKYFVGPPLQQMIQNARLLTVDQKERMLFDSSSVDWRFQRTGHSSFFLFDCYHRPYRDGFHSVSVWLQTSIFYLIRFTFTTIC